jgi:hypothetical protein
MARIHRGDVFNVEPFNTALYGGFLALKDAFELCEKRAAAREYGRLKRSADEVGGLGSSHMSVRHRKSINRRSFVGLDAQ